MASEQPKPADSSFPPTFTGYPPPQGAYPYLPFPPPQEPDATAAPQPAYMMFHPAQGMVYYPSPPSQPNAQAAALRPKRKQVKMACTNCANACKRCDEGRPCERCIKYNTPDTCVDGQRKERKKGIKRGPYKRKNKLPAPDVLPADPAAPDQEWLPAAAPPAVPHAPPPGYVPADGHPPLGFYPMYYPPPGFIHPPPPPAADDAQQSSAAPPHGLPYFLPPYAHPFPYPGLFHPPPPAPAPPAPAQAVASEHNKPGAGTTSPASSSTDPHVPAPVLPALPGLAPEKKKRKSAEGKLTKKTKRAKEPEVLATHIESVSEPAKADGAPETAE